MIPALAARSGRNVNLVKDNYLIADSELKPTMHRNLSMAWIIPQPNRILLHFWPFLPASFVFPTKIAQTNLA
jgi:hypothetical protein